MRRPVLRRETPRPDFGAVRAVVSTPPRRPLPSRLRQVANHPLTTACGVLAALLFIFILATIGVSK